MVVVRLARGGSKKKPFYRVVVADSRNKRDGRFIEQIGYFNPVARGKDIPVKIDLVKFDKWIKDGAQPSDRVAKLAKDLIKAAATPVVEVAEKASEKTTAKKAVAKKATTKDSKVK